MNPPGGIASERAAHKARLIAASERVRREITASLPASGGLESAAARLAEAAGRTLRQPAVIGAIALVVVVAGPRRIFSALRWTLFTMPLHPLGRRLLATVGNRLVGALASSGAGRSGARRG